jgi:hypothetical protein
MIPLSNDPVTIPCPVCATPFEPSGKRRYCRDACRVAAHRRRHQATRTEPAVPEAGQSRRARTVYECGSCDGRALGEQRCDDCGTFMRSLGLGGLCPCCDEPVTIDELLNP